MLIRWLFGVRIPVNLLVQFDPTTPSLSRLLCKVIWPADQSCLEIGIGQGALVSLSIARKHSIQIVGVDCSPERVTQSKTVAESNGIPAEFFVSDLFSSVSKVRRFDLIFFNPPYVPTDVGQRLKFDQRFNHDGTQVWDGGEDGTEVLSRFLSDAQSFLTDRGRIAFGVQSVFVSDSLVHAIIESKGLVVIKRVASRFLPSVCYVVAQL